MTSANHPWIYTYAYAPNQLWEPWRSSNETPPWLPEEVYQVSQRVSASIVDDTLAFVLLTDNHYTINGTWQDTKEAIRRLAEMIKLDGIVHLGDFTDGMVSRSLTRQYVEDMLKDFQAADLSCYATLGNHDCNYFKNNPDWLTLEEQCGLYLNDNPPRYVIDYDRQKLRLIFIDSYDVNEPLRYGFSTDCVEWLGQSLKKLPQEWKVIIFSHLPPLAELQIWAKELRNSAAMIDVLNQYSDKILAYINGHNHCDHLHNEYASPIISINCAKCEYFLEHKPEGAVVPYRALGARTQESFDIMTVNADTREIHFTRFGAGDDRVVRNGKAEWVYGNMGASRGV